MIELIPVGLTPDELRALLKSTRIAAIHVDDGDELKIIRMQSRLEALMRAYGVSDA